MVLVSVSVGEDILVSGTGLALLVFWVLKVLGMGEMSVLLRHLLIAILSPV